VIDVWRRSRLGHGEIPERGWRGKYVPLLF
jgi:hypothetical protein